MTLVFIDLLKVLAAVLITNSHLADVWPISAGQFLSGGEIIKYFVFPTSYHFIASIMILYIVFYLMQYVMDRWNVPLQIVAIIYVAGVMLSYLTVYDRSYAHVDVVEEPFIRCLFFGAMLIGFYFRQKESRPTKYLVKTVVMLFFTAFYFSSKIIVSHYAVLHDIQILTWVTILAALYFIFDWAQCLEPLLLEKIPVRLKKPIHSIAALTLQIYLVQFTVIGMFEHLAFPLNLVVIFIGIILVASILWWADRKIQGILPGKRAGIHTDN